MKKNLFFQCCLLMACFSGLPSHLFSQTISFNPSSKYQGGPSTYIEVNGTGTDFQFGVTTCVQILTTPPLSVGFIEVFNSTFLYGYLNVPITTTPGTYDGVVYQGPGCSGAMYTCSDCFTILETTISFSPSSGDPGTSFGVTVTGTGTRFQNGTTTCIGIFSSPGLAVTGVSVLNATTLTGTLTIPPGTTPGTFDARAYRGPGGCNGDAYDCRNCFTVAAPAPVTLSSFTGKVSDRKVELKWSTASETNSAFFEVQRSGDGKNWIPIGEITAAGFSSAEKNYALLDERPLPEKNYYRLRQADFDGKENYSEVILVKMDFKGFDVQLFPNPNNGYFNATIFSDVNRTAVNITITDIAGKTIQEQVIAVNKGENQIPLDMHTLDSGLYFLKITHPGQSRVTDFVKY